MVKSSMLFVVLIIVSLNGACGSANNQQETIDFADTNFVQSELDTNKTRMMYIAVASMVSPKETFRYYNELIHFVSKKLKSTIFLKQKKTYREVNQLLTNSEVTFAFICSGAYIDGAKNMKIVAVPEINGKIYYQAYVVVNKSSHIESFAQLKGRSFAYTDPISNTGKFYPYKRVSDFKEESDDFFSSTTYTYGHDIALQMVDKGIVDGASVNSLIFDYMNIHYPAKVKNIKIIERSKAFGNPPVVAPNSIRKSLFDSIQQVFFNLHLDSSGRKILNKLDIYRFIPAADSLYDNVRELRIIH